AIAVGGAGGDPVDHPLGLGRVETEKASPCRRGCRDPVRALHAVPVVRRATPVGHVPAEVHSVAGESDPAEGRFRDGARPLRHPVDLRDAAHLPDDSLPSGTGKSRVEAEHAVTLERLGVDVGAGGADEGSALVRRLG
ncbi:hypothetical protein ABE10_00390, partial [Bacillus toyonensis]|nr:hypothetical protein [Bacillus toyonensis]